MNFGVRQGSFLSPFMFAVYIDGIANVSNLRSNLFIVLYANDIILVAPTVGGQLQRLFNSCQEVLDSLDMRINTQKSCCMRIGPRYDAKCVEICSSSGHVIPWVNEFRYLGVFIARSMVFKCSLNVCKKSFYRAANAVFGKVCRTASEEVTLQLVLSKCVSVLLYGLEACQLNASDIRSLDFVINRFFMKLFKTTDIEIAKYCQNIFRFELPSVRLSKLKTRFLASYSSVDNSVCRHILIHG